MLMKALFMSFSLLFCRICPSFHVSIELSNFFFLILQRKRVKSRQSDIVLGKKKCRLIDISRKREIMGQRWKSSRSVQALVYVNYFT